MSLHPDMRYTPKKHIPIGLPYETSSGEQGLRIKYKDKEEMVETMDFIIAAFGPESLVYIVDRINEYRRAEAPDESSAVE